MKRTTVFILVGVGIMLLVVFLLLKSGAEQRRKTNPFEFSVDEFKEVDASLVSHREVTQIRLNHPSPVDLAFHNGLLFILFEKALQGIDLQGKEHYFFSWQEGTASSMTLNPDGQIIIAMQNRLVLFNRQGTLLAQSEWIHEQSGITSLAYGNGRVLAADGHRREVVMFDSQLRLLQRFKGESGVSEHHGFILPGNQFSLRVNAENELWVTNPGIHLLQNYSFEGRLRGHWGKASFGHDGFSGCCNPSYFAFLPDGRFVTSEKGMVRVKIHHESGAFLSYVAPPQLFANGHAAPAVAIGEEEQIILLDFDLPAIRIFSSQN